MPIPNAKMISPSHILFMFCIYKLVRFTLPKIWPPKKKNVQDPSLNHPTLASSSESSEVPLLNHPTPASSSRSFKYDVFLSFRGEDIRKTFVDHFYSALARRQINTYKDDITLPRGESIGPSLCNAIEESRIAVIVFSKNYADSSWCLDELAYIMKCKNERGLIVMPIFYDVDPSEVKKQEGDFGKAFAKQKVKNTIKAELSWRKALVDASTISGWEPKNIANGHEAQGIEEIVDTIFEKLFSLNSHVDEDLVGMNERLKDLESRLDIGSNGVQMVGIWGCGGIGKTTLATSVHMKLSHHFQGHCMISNIREESSKHGLKKLQEDILSAICKREVKVQSVDEGKLKIKNMLHNTKVLVILDDVDDVDQLEALAGSNKWFGNGSRILITSRDQHLLSKVDHVYRVSLLSDEEATRLFKIHAYNLQHPLEDYDTLSLCVVSYAARLPLALKVLGSFLYDKEKSEWEGTLAKLKDIPEMEIVEKLKISYNGLKVEEKELFLDIACFLRRRRPDYKNPLDILEASHLHPKIGIKVLKQKSLITTVGEGFDLTFDMHDLIQEMAYYIVRGEYPMNPEKHSRVWKEEEIAEMCFGDATMENDKIEAIETKRSFFNSILFDSSRLCNIISNMKKLRWLSISASCIGEVARPVFHSNELRYIYWSRYPARSLFPDNFHPTKLVVLELSDSPLKELWKDDKHLPRLKVLELVSMRNLLNTPDFDRLPCLQKLRLFDCDKLEEIHPSLGNHTSLEYVQISLCRKLKRFPTIAHMENLKSLQIEGCHLKDGAIPSGIGELSNLQELYLSENDLSRLDCSLSQLTQLKLLDMRDCEQLSELPELPSSLAILDARGCNSLTTFGDCYKNCEQLCQVTFILDSIYDDSRFGQGDSDKLLQSIPVEGITYDSDKLLQSMLQGNAIETGQMILYLEGAEVAKGFRPNLLSGSRCRFHLPENWANDFSGFLMCSFIRRWRPWVDTTTYIRINQVMGGTDFQDDVYWEESDDNGYTWVGYVSFDSLSHTTWWDQTYKSLEFHIDDTFMELDYKGFGVRLVDKKSKSGPIETSAGSSSHYTPEFEIKQDSTSAVTFSLHPYSSRV